MTTPQKLDEPRRRRWVVAGAWVVLVAALVVGFEHNFVEMWSRWFPAWRHGHLSLYDRLVEGESYYTHGPLVPLVFLVIVLLLIRHTSIPVRPRPVAGGVLLGGSLLLHLTACLARVNFASGFAFIGVLAGLVLTLWGWRALRRLWFPFALLLFMVPLPEVTIYNWNFYLKMLAARIGVAAVNFIGIPAERTQNVVHLVGDKSLEIANVCNGLRTIISLLAFGALYAYVCKLRGGWRLVIFAASVPVAVISNSIRIVSLILVAEWWDVDTATGLYHDWSGILIFAVAFGMMFGLERLILWGRRAVGRPAKVLPLFHDVRRTDADEAQWSTMLAAVGRRAGLVAVLAVLPVAAAASWLSHSAPRTTDTDLASRAVPTTLSIDRRPMDGGDLPVDPVTPTILETQDCMMRRYVPRGGTDWIDLCVVFSKDNRKGTHPPDVCLNDLIVAKGELVVDDVPGRAGVPCRELICRMRPDGDSPYQPTRYVHYLYTYKCGSAYTDSFWVQQFLIFWNGLTDRNASGALVRASTPIGSDVNAAALAAAKARSAAMMRAAIPHLDKGLP